MFQSEGPAYDLSIVGRHTGDVIAIEKILSCSHFLREKLGSTREGQEAEALGAGVGKHWGFCPQR